MVLHGLNTGIYKMLGCFQALIWYYLIGTKVINKKNYKNDIKKSLYVKVTTSG